MGSKRCGRSMVLARVAALALLATGALAWIAPTRARAADAPVRYTISGWQTWVDDEQRLWTAGVDLRPLDPPQLLVEVVVLRDLPTGQPDPTWIDAEGVSGKRTLDLDPPETGAELDPVISVNDAGEILVVWREAGCGVGATCDRWYEAVDATGTTIGPPWAFADEAPPRRSLGDLVLVLGGDDDPLQVFSALRGDLEVPAIAVGEVAAITQSQLGLVVVDRDGTIWVSTGTDGAGEVAELGTTDCPATASLVAGGSWDGGPVLACGGTDRPLEVTRWSADGVEEWTSGEQASPGPITGIVAPTAVYGTPDGGALVAGTSSTPTAQGDALGATIAPIGPDGPEAPVLERLAPPKATVDGYGISRLWGARRGTLTAWVLDERCCTSAGGELPGSRVVSGLLPDPLSPPTCRPGAPVATPTTSSTAAVVFTTCPDGQRAVERPTGYRVEVVGPTITRTGAVEFTSNGGPAATTITQLRGGELLAPRAIARNAQGDSLGGWVDGQPLILPFPSVDAWARQQFLDLLPGPAWAAERASVVAALQGGTLAPPQLVVDLLGRGSAEQRVEPVARTYQAALGRTPDTGGLRYWVGRSGAGLRLAGIAESMARSPEFARRFGPSLSDRAFVARVYRNVLGREGEASGIAYWTRRLGDGLSRGGLVAQFAQSGELIRRSDPTIQPLAAAFLLFGRVPTAAEAAAWATATPRLTAARAVLATATYSRRFLLEDR